MLKYIKEIVIGILLFIVVLILEVKYNQLFIYSYKRILAVVLCHLISIFIILIRIKIDIIEKKMVKNHYINITPFLTSFSKNIPFVIGVLMYSIYISFYINVISNNKYTGGNVILLIAISGLVMSTYYIRYANVFVGKDDIYIDGEKIIDNRIVSIQSYNVKNSWKSYRVILEKGNCMIYLDKVGAKTIDEKYKNIIDIVQ